VRLVWNIDKFRSKRHGYDCKTETETYGFRLHKKLRAKYCLPRGRTFLRASSASGILADRAGAFNTG